MILTIKSLILVLLKHLWLKRRLKFKLPCTVAARNRALEANPEMKDKFFSFEYIRKYHDAILFSTSQRKIISCNTYYIEMRKFLDNYKKEIAYGKKKGMTDKNATAPFTFPLYIKLSTWFLENGMTFG